MDILEYIVFKKKKATLAKGCAGEVQEELEGKTWYVNDNNTLYSWMEFSRDK